MMGPSILTCLLFINIILITKSQDWNIIIARSKSLALKEFMSNQKTGRKLISLAILPPRNGSMEQSGFAAIFSKFAGPDWASHFEEKSFENLQEKTEEYGYRDFLVTKSCGYGNKDKINYWIYYEKVTKVAQHMVFPVNETDLENGHFDRMQRNHFRLSYICGFEHENQAMFMVVWRKPAKNDIEYKVHYNEPLEKCLDLHRSYFTDGFTATVFQAFEINGAVKCAAIWEKRLPYGGHAVLIDSDLSRMVQNMSDSRLQPLQISTFNENNTRKYVILWGKPRLRPPSEKIWGEKAKIPVTFGSQGQKSFSSKVLSKIEEAVGIFMKNFNIPGLSLALSEDGKLKYSSGFGYSNVFKKTETNPEHLFRIGTTSKTITSAAIFRLIDMGKLKLDQEVFGRHGILRQKLDISSPFYNHLSEVTLKHLLEETAVWAVPAGALQKARLQDPEGKLLSWIVDAYPLRYKPGSHLEKSYLPFMVLGAIIEAVSGQSYQHFVVKNLFRPAGVKKFGIGPGKFDRNSTEVVYYGSGFGDPYDWPNEYDILPAAGWLLTPNDMLRFLVRIDGFPTKTDFLHPQSVRRMAAPSKASNGTYARGWTINPGRLKGWLSIGELSGSTALLLRANNGIELAACMNTNRRHDSMDFYEDLLRMAEQLVINIQTEPDIEL